MVNTFLIKASDALETAEKPHRMLIVQDNLDRLSREAAMAVFSESAELLQQLQGAFVWPAPEFLAQANLDRERFPAACPQPVLLCLYPTAVGQFVRFAPDLWHWRLHNFVFTESGLANVGQFGMLGFSR